MQVVTFTELRNNLREIMDASADQFEPTVIKRTRGENMVLLSQSSYDSLLETAYLLSGEANADHLRKSIKSLKGGKLMTRKLIEE